MLDKKTPPLHVYVHLAHGMGAVGWEERYHNGQLLGINEVKPYGYFRAADDSCKVEYSVDTPENVFQKIWRGLWRVILGFDFVHVWRNAERVWRADVVWTHTESQTLGILELFSLFPARRRPKLIGQCVWLFDKWSRLSFIKKWLYSKLLARADILTVHSPENLKICRALFPHVRSELVLFGIKAEPIPAPARKLHDPIRIVSIGNDTHRDWATLIAAFRDVDGFEVKIVTAAMPPSRTAGTKNIRIEKVKRNQELLDIYRWADVAVVALKPNFHASGITVIQEAVLQNLPVVCTDTGGLKAYFSENEVRYVPIGNPDEMRKAIANIADNPESRETMVQLAAARMGEQGLGSQAFVRRHVELSRELIKSLNLRLWRREFQS